MDYKELETYIQKVMISTFDKVYLIQDGVGYLSIPLDNKDKTSKLEVNKDLSSLFSNFEGDILDAINKISKGKLIVATKDGSNALISINAIGKYKSVSIIYFDEKRIIDEKKKTILIADDSKMITNFIIKAVGDNYNVLTAGDGNEVLELVNNHKIDGIFLDLEMPIKNGYEVLEEFNSLDIFSRIPVAVISGENSKDGIEKTANYPIIDILQKPFSIETAASFIDRIVNIEK